jgi:hypothetical protein
VVKDNWYVPGDWSRQFGTTRLDACPSLARPFVRRHFSGIDDELLRVLGGTCGAMSRSSNGVCVLVPWMNEKECAAVGSRVPSISCDWWCIGWGLMYLCLMKWFQD